MAVTVTTSLPSIERDSLDLTISGTLDGTVEDIVVDVVDPNNVAYNFTLTPDVFTNPTTLPQTYSLSPFIIGINTTNFEDGAYSFTVTIDYTGVTPTEIATVSYLLFNNNLRSAYVDLFESTICLWSSCSKNDKEKISQARQSLDAAQVFFDLSRYNDAKRVLDCGLDVVNEKYL